MSVTHATPQLVRGQLLHIPAPIRSALPGRLRVAAAHARCETPALHSGHAIKRAYVKHWVCQAGGAHNSLTPVQTITATTVSDPAADAPYTAAQLAQALAIPQSTAFRLQQQFSSLSNTAVQQLVLDLHKACGASLEDLALSLSKEPRLSSVAPQDLKTTFEALCEITSLPAEAVGRLATFAPSALCTSAEDLRAQYAALLERLQVDADMLRELIVKQPNMLLSPVPMVVASLERVKAVLDLASNNDAAALVCAYPAVVAERPDMLQHRVQGLCTLFACDVACLVAMARAFPPLLTTSVDITASRLDTLAEALRISTFSLLALLRSCPALLAVPPTVLQPQIDKLVAYFGSSQGLTRDQVVGLLAENPSLLALDGIQ